MPFRWTRYDRARLKGNQTEECHQQVGKVPDGLAKPGVNVKGSRQPMNQPPRWTILQTPFTPAVARRA